MGRARSRWLPAASASQAAFRGSSVASPRNAATRRSAAGRERRARCPQSLTVALRQGVGKGRRAERDEPANAPALAPLEHVARHEAAQAVPDDVDLGLTGRLADRLYRAPEPPRELLVVHPRRIREGREVVEAAPHQEAAKDAKLARVAEKAVHEHDRRRMGRARVGVRRGGDPHLGPRCEGGEWREQKRAHEVEASVREGPRDERRQEGAGGDRHAGIHAAEPEQTPCPVRTPGRGRRPPGTPVPRGVARGPAVHNGAPTPWARWRAPSADARGRGLAAPREDPSRC